MNTIALLLLTIAQPSVPVVYISGPHGPTSATTERQGPYRHPDGCDLKVRWADGKVETLVVGNQPPLLSCSEPCVSLDGKSVLYVHFGNDGRGARVGDIWRLDLGSLQRVRITNAAAAAEWNPPRGTANWAPHPTPLNSAEQAT